MGYPFSAQADSGQPIIIPDPILRGAREGSGNETTEKYTHVAPPTALWDSKVKRIKLCSGKGDEANTRANLNNLSLCRNKF